MYGKLIKEITSNEALEIIAYGILIYEDFNRPKVARIVENINFRVTKKSHTLGVMQVKSNKILTDKESVILGTTKIINAHKAYLEKIKIDNSSYYEYYAKSEIISDYNIGTKYNTEVIELTDSIREIFYKNSTDTLEQKI